MIIYDLNIFFLGQRRMNIGGQIAKVPACSSGALTNVMPHRNAMPQSITIHPVTVYRHGADQSLCYPLMWSVTLEYTAIHLNVLDNRSPTYGRPDGRMEGQGYLNMPPLH